MRDTTVLTNQCQQFHTQGKSHEEIVSFLRTQGCSKIESMAVLVKALGIDLGKAKEIVHLSSVWADTRERDDQFHKSLEDGMEQENP